MTPGELYDAADDTMRQAHGNYLEGLTMKRYDPCNGDFELTPDGLFVMYADRAAEINRWQAGFGILRNDLAAANNRIKELEAALSKVRAETIEACHSACEKEILHDHTGTEGDIGYNAAIRDCCEAIRALHSDSPTKEPG